MTITNLAVFFAADVKLSVLWLLDDKNLRSSVIGDSAQLNLS